MPLERVSQSFSDVSMSFKKNPLNDDLILLKNANAIARSIKNIVFTFPGEKPFNEKDINLEQRPEIDRWILSELNTLIKEVGRSLDDFEATKNLETHCGKCWFCLERLWGFGKL